MTIKAHCVHLTAGVSNTGVDLMADVMNTVDIIIHRARHTHLQVCTHKHQMLKLKRCSANKQFNINTLIKAAINT